VAELDRLPLSRRAFVGNLVVLLGAFAPLPALLERAGLREDALAADTDLVTDTLNGLVAFVVPGPDPYSVAQGAHTEEPGGLGAGVTPALILGLNSLQEFQPALAASVAALLNGVAQQVDPAAATGPFPSPFANLSFADKAAVFAVLEGEQAFAPLRPLAGVLPALVGFLAYSEVGVFDPTTRTLAGRPVGWALSNYEGVADGRDELRGYFENRRRADA
jgi:hypothetical protein